jgi:hypothetical protein
LVVAILTGSALAAVELTAPNGQIWGQYGFSLSLGEDTLAISGSSVTGFPGATTICVYYPVIASDNSDGFYSGNLYVAMYDWTGNGTTTGGFECNRDVTTVVCFGAVRI